MDQYDEEKLVMEQFRKYYPEFPKGKLIKSESPDFILKINPKKSIGIELTRLDVIEGPLYDRINNSITRKEAKIVLYQNWKFHDIWLVIYTDLLIDTEMLNLSNKLHKWNFVSRFSRLFLYDLFHNLSFDLVNHVLKEE